MNIIKRSGTLEPFDSTKISNAIIRAMNETKIGVDRKLAEGLADTLTKEFSKQNIPMTVEEVQERIEFALMDSDRKDVARQYIVYRNARNRARASGKTKVKKEKLLSDEFISMYKHSSNPFPTQLGEFVYYRTYSRWLPLEQRREYWWETVQRAVEYNCSLVPGLTTTQEAEQLFDNIYNLKQFLSGRTFWVGGTKVASHYPMANFNCAFETIDDFESFRDLFYLLMVGSGVGIRVLKEDVAKLPKIRTNVNIIHESYTSIAKDNREDNTSLRFNNNIAYLVIGDSKEGWVQSLEHFFRILYSNEYKNINTIILNYNNVRPKGETLNTFGGTASGHESLKNMFYKIDKIIKKIGIESDRVKLTPLNCLDFCNIIGENVVIGGVRRTAEIALIDSDDNEVIQAKTNLYKQVDGQWVVDKDLIHRQMSNNSIYYTSKPSRERLHWQIEQMRFSGEPAWINAEAAEKRRPNMNGVNPSMPKDVKVQTTTGIYNINELEGKSFYVKSLNGEIAPATCWLSNPSADVYTIDFKGGRTTHATSKHKFPIIKDKTITRKLVSEIKKGDRIPLNRNELQGFSNNLTYEDGLIAGMFIGDGSITQRKDDNRFVASFTVNDKDIEIKEFIDKIYTEKTKAILKWNRRSLNSKSQETNFGKQEFVKGYLIDVLGLSLSKEGKSLPSQIWTSGDNFALGLVDGLFSTDGNVDDSGASAMSISVCLTTSQTSLAEDIQKLLSFYGISSSINTRKTKPTFPNGKVYDKEYTINRVRISGSQVLRFTNIFKMIAKRKQDKIDLVLPNLTDRDYITVDSVKYRSTEAVWDISVKHEQHVFPSQHCYTGNCGEILLDSKGMCNLTTVNCFAFVRMNGTLDKQGLLNAQKLSARAGYRMTVVDLELPKWDLVQKRDRLIGCSLTGWQDMVNALQFTKEQEIELLEELRETAIEEAQYYAEILGLEYPLLVTTVKPEGCATKDHVRTLDNGIFFLDEINPDIEEHNGFQETIGQLTFNGNQISKTYKNDIKDGLRLGFKNGRKLDITPSHLMSINNEWVEAYFLKIGDILDYKLGFYNNKNNESLIKSDYEKVTNAIIEKTPFEMSEDLAWLLGAYFANGSFTTQHRIKFHCQYKEVHEKVQKIWKELFNIETTIVKLNDRNSYVQDFASANIRNWLDINGLDKIKDFERIPLPIRKSSKEVILSFIVGYADNDGCFSSKTFCIDSSSEIFIRHLQEVGEAVGLSFGVSINKKRGEKAFTQNFMYKAHLSRSFSTQESIDYINNHSIKALLKGKIIKGLIRSANPYKITSITSIESIQTYDIEVENEHWYYQGALKSHNTLSQLPTVSSGVHYAHSPYFIRRVRINAHDPLVKVCEELGYPIYPEVGQNEKTCTTKVLEFPVKAPDGRTKYNVSAIEQLENYKMFMDHYVDHNCSITVHVRENEWELVEEWIWNNWDEVVAVSFLSLDDSFYALLPYEEIKEEEYERRLAEIKDFIPSLLTKYESKEINIDIGTDGCEGGQCPVR